MSDSLMLEATGEGKDRLVLALGIAPLQQITSVCWERTQNCLKLTYESNKDGTYRLTFPPALVADTVCEWLDRRKGSNPSYSAPEWPREPDIDGDVKKGWRIVASDTEIEIHPHWMIYHK